MPSLRVRTLSLRAAGIAAATLLFAGSAAAGEIYSWRTEDGTTAFTDDSKAVPARYREQAAVRESEGLAGYDRLTAPEVGASSDYARRLSNRLDHLRALNQGLDAARTTRRAAAVRTLEVEVGGLQIGVPVDSDGDGPVVIENVRLRPSGGSATRHDVIVRKGGRTLTVIRGGRNAGGLDPAPPITERVD